MRVFVLNKHGEQLMPCKPRKAKKLLNEKKAKVIRRSSFTIQLLNGFSGYKQNLTLGVDTGHNDVGLSVISETKEVFSAVAKMKNDISAKMTRLLEMFPDAIETFGYVTKANRYANNIEKTHANDAFVIAGGTTQERDTVRFVTFKRKNNRSLQKNRKGFAPSIRRQRYQIQPTDLIKYQGWICVAKGTQNKGAYAAFMDGTKRVVKSTKQLALIFQNKGIIYA